MSQNDKNNKKLVRSALEGHGWIGVFIAIPLFIIFWAGSLTLFYPEIKAWSILPHTSVNVEKSPLPVNHVVDSVISNYEVDLKQRMFVVLPTSTQPLYEFYLPINNEKEYTSLFVNPLDGSVVGEIEDFHLADFLYQLHIDLNLPFGEYIVGVVTLFFMVVLLTGVIVHFKKLITHFFYYRGANTTTRYQLTDLHNVVGVVSLPYTFIFALTGLMFNLGIVSQIVTLLFVYDGDRETMANDSGFPRIVAQHSGVAQKMPDLDALIESWEQQQNAHASSIRLTNYQDKNALIRLIGHHNENFEQRIDMTYSVSQSAFSSEMNPKERNAFADGTRFLYALHFGHFAGMDVRIVFFILGICVCGLIIVGNMLWLHKFNNNKHISQQVKRTISALTLGGCAGIVPATALAFLLERILPASLSSRALYVELIFFGFYAVMIFTAFRSKNTIAMVSRIAFSSGIVLTLLLMYEGIRYSNAMFSLACNGTAAPLLVSFVCFCLASMLFAIALRLPEFNKIRNAKKITKHDFI